MLSGEPVASGDRAAVESWGSWREQGEELTFAGVTVLRFDHHGTVVDHRDYDNHAGRREAAYAGWQAQASTPVAHRRLHDQVRFAASQSRNGGCPA